MKSSALISTLFAGSSLCGNVVVGTLQKICYSDLENRCVVYHTNSYPDGFDRLYVPDGVQASDLAINASAVIKTKIEKWTPFVDNILRKRNTKIEFRNAADDFRAYKLAVGAGLQNNNKRSFGSDGALCALEAVGCIAATGAVAAGGIPAAVPAVAACVAAGITCNNWADDAVDKAEKAAKEGKVPSGPGGEGPSSGAGASIGHGSGGGIGGSGGGIGGRVRPQDRETNWSVGGFSSGH